MTSDYVPCQKDMHTTPENKKVIIWHINLKDIITHDIKKKSPQLFRKCRVPKIMSRWRS